MSLVTVAGSPLARDQAPLAGRSGGTGDAPAGRGKLAGTASQIRPQPVSVWVTLGVGEGLGETVGLGDGAVEAEATTAAEAAAEDDEALGEALPPALVQAAMTRPIVASPANARTRWARSGGWWRIGDILRIVPRM